MSSGFDIEKMLAERPSEARQPGGLLRVGQSIGPWRVIAFLGRGRSSEVYRVVNTRIGGDGALKILADGGMGLRERFLFERELVGSLSIPALPRFFGSGEHEGRPYYVMEHLQPLTLPLEKDEAPRFVAMLARSVAALHEAGFLHRDLKPANVLRRVNGEPVIIDLGLVKRSARDDGAPQSPSELSMIGGKRLGVGTLDFAAPEQLLKGEATEASDVFALGKVLKACCGPRATKAMREVIRRATAEDPSDRYPTAKEFADAVDSGERPRFVSFIAGTGIRKAAVACVALVVFSLSVVLAWRGGKASGREEAGPSNPGTATSMPGPKMPDPKMSVTQMPGESDEDHFRRLLKLALDGGVDASAAVAEAYFNGHGVATNQSEAVEWYRIAADGGHVGSLATLGLCRLRGLGCEKDAGEAASLFLEAANKGHLGSMANLAFCFMHGLGVDRDPEAAFGWAMMAAERGHAAAQTFVGECYLDGRGVAQDRRRADDWLTRAARQGNERAQMLLRTR
ncbi:MAG: hypothetical protein E7049_09775 [Lentisphaerae bacterium]|nr:hypothetical protein [Lentisphaerota bacterium]